MCFLEMNELKFGSHKVFISFELCIANKLLTKGQEMSISISKYEDTR